MDNVIVTVVEQLGYFGIALLMVLENVFPPIPSEAIMGAGGLAVHRGSMSFVPLLVSGTIGTLIGNWVWFWIGNKWGYERLGPFIDRWGHWLTLEWEDVEASTWFFRRHGHWVVFFLRATPFMRTMISLPAGLAHMGRVKFLVFTAAGAAIWNAMLILGTQWLARRFGQFDDLVSWIIIATIVLAVGGYAVRWFTWKPRAKR